MTNNQIDIPYQTPSTLPHSSHPIFPSRTYSKANHSPKYHVSEIGKQVELEVFLLIHQDVEEVVVEVRLVTMWFSPCGLGCVGEAMGL